MTGKPEINLRAKKLGLLLKDARLTAGKTKKECAQMLGITMAAMNTFESGAKSPSLPELEVLAFFLDTPVEYFYGDELKSKAHHPSQDLDVTQIISLRTRIIGALIRQARNRANLTLKDLSSKARITPPKIKKYENGEQPIPVPDLEKLAKVLEIPLKEFANPQGHINEWMVEQHSIQKFLDLPVELKEFIGQPVNHPYLQLAKRLSGLSAKELRSVAEGLLEISL